MEVLLYKYNSVASYKIGQYFNGKGAEGSTAHILAHTILGATVAVTGGNNALTAGIAAGGAEAAAPLLSQYLYGKEAKDLTASEKSTISSIVGLAGSAVGAITGDVSSTVQSGQSAQNAVENNYQTKATLRVVNKQLQKCSPSDRGCIERGISALRKADKILDNHFKTCAQTNDASCVKNHLEQILASDASPEMKETIQLLKQLGISTETMGLLNETSGYSQKETQLVEDARAGKDLGCISGTTQNCIAPTSKKTFGEKAVDFVNEATLKQIWAAAGLKNDVLTGEEITPNERQLAIASMLSGGILRVTTKGAIELTEKGTATLVKKYGSVEAKKIENNFNRDNDSITEAFNYGKTISIDPSKLSFSQATVSYQKVGKTYDYDSMVKSMKKDGWNGDPVDIVIMPNGTATSMDNTRILAAREAGANVQAKVRDFNTPLTSAEKDRFTSGNKVPNTWGEAIKLRVERQGSQKGVPENWSIEFPYGSIYDPKVIKSK